MIVGEFRKTKAFINLKHLEDNIRTIQSTLSVKTQFFCPMVKADAYGHGDVEIARVCEKLGVSGVGVALLGEGIRLRENGIKIPIYVFGPILDSSVQQLVKYSLTPVIGQWPELRALNNHLKGREFGVHLKVNTGMNRLGFSKEEFRSLETFFTKESNLKLDGICSHLACGSDLGLPESETKKQIINFEKAIDTFSQFSPTVHLWNSSGWFAALKNLNESDKKRSWGVRPGISIYGIFPEKTESQFKLKPVMSLVSEIVTLQNIKKGSGVSYGLEWIADRQSQIAIVPVGYADGYSRFFSNKSWMIVGGQKVPVRGIVCMDYTHLDVTDLNLDPKQDLGKEVVIMGEKNSKKIGAEDLAEMIQTIPYEILTGIGRRVPREYIGEN